MRLKLILLFIIFPSLYCFSQKEPVKTSDSLDNTDEAIEKLIENQTVDVEDSRLLDYLKKLQSDPIDINAASAEKLESIPFINAVTAKRIVNYRTKNGSFKDIIILKKVEGIDDDLYNNIRSFLTVARNKPVIEKQFGTTDKFFFNLRSRFTNDLQPSKGFLGSEPKYLGAKPKIYNRIQGKYILGNYTLNAGVLTEKDAGEKKLFDFFSGYASISSDSYLNFLVGGDFTLEFGQGLTLWSSLAFSKGSDAVSTIKKHPGDIDAYTSVNEVQFFRGGAAKFKFPVSFGNFNLYGFYSANYFDASLDSGTTLSTIYYDGYHRDTSEINKQKTGKETLYGGRINFENNFLRLGITGYKSSYSDSFKVKDIYDFSGKTSNALGLDFDYVINNVNLFGEIARSYTGAIGGVSGLKIVLGDRKVSADLVMNVRYYPKDFIMLHAFGFGEQSNTQNEFGIYSGIKLKLGSIIKIDAYYDQFKFPYRTFSVPIPSSGNDFLNYNEIKINKSLTLFSKYKSESKEDVITVKDEFGHDIKKLFSRSQKNYRLQFDYNLSNFFRVRSRFEYVFVDYDSYIISEKGFLFFSDFRVRPFKLLSLEGRIAVFQTDSYDSRLYEYESELDGVVSNQGLYGKGKRWYLIAKYKPYPYLELSAKYSETFFDGVKTIGSGYDEIFTNFKNRFAVQLDIKF